MKSYKVLFTKLENAHTRLRTDTMEGSTIQLPAIGQQFVMYGAPLESGSFRRLNTSPVKEVELVDSEYIIKTESGSKYSIKVLEEIED